MTTGRALSLIVRLSSLTALSAAVLPCQVPGLQSGMITLKDTRLYYETVGRGPAVVFIHGFALNVREWDDQVKALAPSYRVISYDRRGFGQSTGIADPSSEPEDLRELLDTLGVRSAVLIGHSGGSQVAARFMVAHPERVDGLVFYPAPQMSGFPIAPSEPNPLGNMGVFARAHGMDSLFTFMMSLPEFWMPPNRPDIDARIKAMIATYSGRDLIEGRVLRGPYRIPTFEEMRRLTIPTMFITGERERKHAILVGDSLARWMPNARSVVLRGGGHGVHFAEPDRFNDALLAFLRTLAAGRR